MPEKYKLATQDTGKAEEAEPVSSYDTGKIKEAEPVFSCRTLLAGTTDEPVLEGLIDLSDRSTYEMENILNKRRLRQFKENYTKELLRILCEQDFEYGFDSSADLFVRELMGQNETITKEWLNSVYIEQFHDIRVVIGLLQVISHLQYSEIYPQGPTMALAALSHANSEVRECGIRAFENWGTKEYLKVLRNVRCPEIWMQKYLSQVIQDIEEEFGVQ
jgi:hypothetical protein